MGSLYLTNQWLYKYMVIIGTQLVGVDIGSCPAAARSSVEAIRSLGTSDEKTIDKIYSSCLNSSDENCCHAT